MICGIGIKVVGRKMHCEFFSEGLLLNFLAVGHCTALLLT